jgi:ubiquinone/menaquinone biosynthesis C-methylase UbiE
MEITSTLDDHDVINAYERLWADANHIQTLAYRCGGPKTARRTVDYLGFDILDSGLRGIQTVADSLMLDSESEVLEIGSGIGGPARFIAERYQCNTTGIDFTPRQIEISNTLTKGLDVRSKVQFLLSDATTLPFRAQSFSHVYSIEALVHMRQKQKVIEEAFRVLRPGGSLCIRDMTGFSDIDITLLEGTIHPFSVEEYEDALNSAGFCKVSFLDCTKESEEGYETLGQFVSNGIISPVKLLNMLENIHPGIRPPIWRHITPTRIIHSIRYLLNRCEAARDLFGNPEHISRIRKMCFETVSAYRIGALNLYQIYASRPLH